jgi:hypothetical protein
MYYAGGPQQVTEYVSRNVQRSRIPPAWCNKDVSYVRQGGGHTALCSNLLIIKTPKTKCFMQVGHSRSQSNYVSRNVQKSCPGPGSIRPWPRFDPRLTQVSVTGLPRINERV